MREGGEKGEGGEQLRAGYGLIYRGARAEREVSIAATDFAPLGLLFLGRNLLNAQCKQGEGKGIRAAFLNRDILDVSAACRESFRVFTLRTCFTTQPAGRASYCRGKGRYS